MFDNEKSDKRKAIDGEINVGLRRLKIDVDDDAIGSFISNFSERDFGLCYDCKCLYAFKTEYGTMRGKCYEFEIIMNGINKIKHCTRYDKKGQMSLDDMKDMAILIDDEKKKVGFGFV
jgi:hypothetical protein